MKKFSKIIIIAFLLISLIGCNGVKTEKKLADASWYFYSYDQMLELSDIIAEVKILTKLKEIEGDSPRTIFTAKVIDVYKGLDNQAKEVKLAQIGSSKVEYKDYEVFKKNDKMILFLKKTQLEEVGDVYIIIGAISGTFHIESVKGNEYITNKIAPIHEMNHIEDSDIDNKIKKSKDLNDLVKYHPIKKENFKKQILEDLEKKLLK